MIQSPSLRKWAGLTYSTLHYEQNSFTCPADVLLRACVRVSRACVRACVNFFWLWAVQPSCNAFWAIWHLSSFSFKKGAKKFCSSQLWLRYLLNSYPLSQKTLVPFHPSHSQFSPRV